MRWANTKPKPAFGTIMRREYPPHSAGTIFRDTGNVVIRNNESLAWWSGSGCSTAP